MGGGNRRHGWSGQKARVEVEKDSGRKDRRDIKYGWRRGRKHEKGEQKEWFEATEGIV